MEQNIKTYAIINIGDLAKIDFNQILQTSTETIRESVNEGFFVIKWIEGNEPSFITDGEVIPESILNHDEALELMNTESWKTPIEE